MVCSEAAGYSAASLNKLIGNEVRKMSNYQNRRRHSLPRFTLEHDQRGQAIVLIALMIVLLLGMAALAIDGGGLFFLKRDAQNAADAAALIASRELCVNPGGDWVARGKEAATENGFTTGVNTAGFNTVTVTVKHPEATPAGAPPGAAPDQYAVVEIKATKPAYFSQLVYGGTLDVTVQAVSRCVAPKLPGNVPGIVGLGACGRCNGTGTSQNTVDWSGSGVDITGGMHSNCNCDLNGSGQTSTINGDVSCSGVLDPSGDIVYPDGTPAQGPTDAPVISDPLAAAFPLSVWQSGNKYAEAASDDTCDEDGDPNDGGSCYHVVNATFFKTPIAKYEGLYYITGDATGPNAIQITAFGDKGATFILADGAVGFGKIDNWVKPYNRADRMLVASYLSNTCGVVISGPPNKPKWSGFIYGPSGECEFSMADGFVTWGAMICQRVKVSGSYFSLYFDPSMIPPSPGEIAPSQ
jgi:hypothetical protein